MKSLTEPANRPRILACGLAAAALMACSACEREPERAKSTGPAEPVTHITAFVVESPPGTLRPPFQFSPDDEAFLDRVQQGAFKFFWEKAHPKTGLIPDRSSATVISMAGVGFQLSSLPIGIQRGWITREEGEARALLILRTLAGQTDTRKNGLFYHFLDGETGGLPSSAPEQLVSTIDSALFFCGAIAAGEYFKGEVGAIANRFVEEADWSSFVVGDEGEARAKGFISLGWKPADIKDPTGQGSLLDYAWIDSGDEHRLVTFLALAAPRADHRVPADLYYRLRRQMGSYGDTGPLCWFPWSGALFVSTFAHCYIDYAAMGPDDPAAMKVARRPRIDWWENARRTARLHQLKCAENPRGLPTLSDKAWGLSASDKQGGYLVAGVFPNALPMGGAIPEIDYPVFKPKDDWGDGTIAPYAAGSAIMFDPKASIAAMRYYAQLKDRNGNPLVWRDPASGGHGFRDAFNLGTMWAGEDDLAIDQGPLLVAIENARSGLIWRLFASSAIVKEGTERLGWKPSR
jgi:hypothetical protein